MTRKFYQVNPEAYLFGRSKSPEEQVRQWVMFELLSTYGVNINDISIEVPVKVGRRIHSADIVIHQSYIPSIVIECKREGENPTKALDQAISYARSDNIKAEYAVCTDGQYWLVKRKFRDEWVAVPDIPKRRTHEGLWDMSDFLPAIHYLKPLLHWLHGSVPQEHAPTFFYDLQTFTAYSMSFFEANNPDLYQGTERLLRVLKHDPILTTSYGITKMKSAFRRLMDYLISIGTSDRGKDDRDFEAYHAPVAALYSDYQRLAIASQNLNNQDALLVRLVTSLLQYLREVQEHGDYIDISARVTNQLGSFLAPILEEMLGVKLPDSLDDLTFIQAYSEYKKRVNGD